MVPSPVALSEFDAVVNPLSVHLPVDFGQMRLTMRICEEPLPKVQRR
jgi:hypothetical protein